VLQDEILPIHTAAVVQKDQTLNNLNFFPCYSSTTTTLNIIISRYVPSLSDMAWNLLVGLDIDATRFADDTWDIPER
jgi:hypothetical protein